jgi:PP-loop superfamily ATP-utilizing enzyme
LRDSVACEVCAWAGAVVVTADSDVSVEVVGEVTGEGAVVVTVVCEVFVSEEVASAEEFPNTLIHTLL